MGEEVKKEEPKQAEKAEQQTEKKAEDKTDEKVQSQPTPPPPVVLYIDLHCVGCAKKIEKILTKIKGIDEVVIDMSLSQVTLKGVVEPQAICNRIMKKTKRTAKVLSPLPQAEGEPIPDVVASEASELNTVELSVNMHCEACADQLKKKILKMKGVQNVEIELSSSKVIVKGSMDPKNLVDYVYRRTKKLAKIVPQPEPETSPAEDKKAAEDEKPKEEEKVDGKKSDHAAESGKSEDGKAEEVSKEELEHYQLVSMEEAHMSKMHHFYPRQQPLYFVERLPPAPQMFSDENPNACSIC